MSIAVRSNKRCRAWVSPGLVGWGRVLPLCLLSLAAGWLYPFAVHAADAAGPAVLSGCEIDYPPFCIVHEDGRADGFSVELMRAALGKMGREVRFRTGPWAEVRGWLERGEVDALPLVGRTPEREPLFDFTVPYMTKHGAIVVREETTDVHSLADLRGRRVGVMKGDNAEEFLRREERGLEILTTPTFSDAFHALAEGRCDAVVVQRLLALRLLKETGLRKLKIVERPILEFSQDFCFAVREGDRELLSVLNEGLALAVADGTHRRLHAKWFAALELPADRPIVVGGDHHYPPFEFLDDKGRPAGFTVELTRAIAGEMNLDVRIELGPWADTVERLKQGEIDAVQGIFYTPERDRTLNFSSQYLVSHYVGVTRADDGAPLETLSALAGRSVAVQAGDAILEPLVQQAPDARIMTVETQEDIMRAVMEGDTDCGVIVRFIALHFISENGWAGLRLGKQSLFAGEYCYAVPQGNDALLAQFTEGLRILKHSGEYQRIYDKWLGVYEDQFHWSDVLKLSALIAAPLLLLVVLALLWSWSLKRQVRARTRELRESLDRFQSVFEAANVGKSLTLPTGEINANQAYAEMLGYAREELQGRTWQELTPTEDVPETEQRLKPLLDGQEDAARFEKRYVRKDGGIVWTDVSVTLLRDRRHQPLHFITTVVDITERKRAEERLREKTGFLQNITNHMFDMVAITDLAGVFTYAGPSHRILGFEPEEFLGTRVFDYVHPDDAANIAAEFASFVAHPSPDKARTVEYRQRCKDGTYLWLETMGKILFDDDGTPYSILFSSRNITWRKEAEAERDKLQSQFMQVQRMESVGRLAGGVAHDFNNMLSVILGHAELMFECLPDDSSLRDDLEEIRKAADRSADLTRQLLAFARKQTVAPKVLDLNETITSMLKMLQRLIGEDIDLLWQPGALLAPVRMDPGQVDQILANLAVNARDAIGHDPGKVTIETSNACFDEAYCAEHAGFVPGDYVMLAVSDDGCGMDEETRANIFDPFFTTKGMGEGTGLGLATLYGIVKQNDGFVNCYSEAGTGTTFRLYFPALAEASTRSIAAAPGPTAMERGDETILVVEDQPALLELARQMLERLGYTVLTAGAPDEALRAARDYEHKIDLLITDVVMPEMNGRALAEHLQSIYPGLKALYMSGYTANVIAHHGVLDEGVNFIQKPFSLHDLARQVREALLR
jgi:PAS domain S-box-containing protein